MRAPKGVPVSKSISAAALLAACIAIVLAVAAPLRLDGVTVVDTLQLAALRERVKAGQGYLACVKGHKPAE
jgi:hypothetical protein